MRAVEPEPLLQVEGLAIGLPGAEGEPTLLVDAVSFSLGAGERVGMVGESGSGKSLTALALLDVLPPPLRITSGSVRIDGHDLLAAPEAVRCRLRGGTVGLVPQEPASAINPVFSLGFQLREVIARHRGVSRREARAGALELLRTAGLEPGRDMARAYAHQFSGGQLQRAVIALALAGGPRILVADEPTTALDAVTRAGILALLEELTAGRELGLLLISHDLGVVAGAVERILVAYAGEIVEEGPVAEILEDPVHPYTRGLLAAARELHRSGAARRELPALPGAVPRPGTWGPGCRFAPRCPLARDACRAAHPGLLPAAPGRAVRCPVVLEGAGR